MTKKASEELTRDDLYQLWNLVFHAESWDEETMESVKALEKKMAFFYNRAVKTDDDLSFKHYLCESYNCGVFIPQGQEVRLEDGDTIYCQKCADELNPPIAAED